MGIVVLLMVTLAMGIVEFGRMLMILNIITNATRDAARAASAVNPVLRCRSTANLNTSAANAIKSMVVNQVNGYIPITDSNVAVNYIAASGSAPRMIEVQTTVNVPWVVLFPFVGNSLPVNRTITFRDEFTIGSDTAC